RQTHAYNELLSDRRAKATLEFMVKSGINRNRLTAKGYGETQLVNECSDGILCSEEDHQKNRRSEFIVMKM
ncbi:MAG: OmpA family protein, partial [Flavobacterium sp.]|nr:OmpA family protein [Flavobacterium sp.]